MTSVDSVPHRYRLRGIVGDEPRTFLLHDGPNLLGAHHEADVLLPVQGVSRRHARMGMNNGDGWTLEDLGSKNGTFVNSRRVDRGAVTVGDEVAIGTIRLILETIDADDAELAMTVKSPTESSPTTGHDTSLLSREPGLDGDWLALADRFLGHLAPPSSDFEGALALAASTLGASAAALVEWPDGRQPAVLAVTGEVAAVPDLATLRSRARSIHGDSTLRCGRYQAPVPLIAALHEIPGLDPLGLILWGDDVSRRMSRRLLAHLLRLTQAFRPQPMATLGPRPTPAADDSLRFPESYVRGSSPAMNKLYGTLRALAPSDVPVLVLGETGVGKEPLARALHASSGRRNAPLVTINCAALPAELLEAELFGIGKGVATGVAPRTGKFQQADGGTLFLDEIGDMAPALQAKLLRALQEKEIHPLGRPPEAIDVRIVAATHADLGARIEEGRFRSDLYYRLAGDVLAVPPLRQRAEDVPPLIACFIRRFAAERGKAVRGVTVKALKALTAYPWPGNVRELEHEVRRMVTRCGDGQAIDSTMVTGDILIPPPNLAALTDALDLEAPRLDIHVERVERQLIAYALKRTGGNQSQAARLLGISRNGLANRLKRLEIQAGESAFDD